MSDSRGGCIGSIFTLLKIAVGLFLLYIILSFFYNTPSSDRVRGEYTNIKGTLERIDVNNIDFAALENQGSSSLNTLGAVVTELWDASCASVQGLFQSLSPSGNITNSPTTPAGWPVDKSRVGSIGSYGMRLHPTKIRFIKHKGIDLACAAGTPIYATADGVVEISTQGEPKRGYGVMILIAHDGQHKSRYAHLSSRAVEVGQRVQRGQVIGYVGSSGDSTGAHLHYEVVRSGYAVNPMPYMKR